MARASTVSGGRGQRIEHPRPCLAYVEGSKVGLGGVSGRLVQRAGSQTACAGIWEAEIKGRENSRFSKATLSQKRVTEVSSLSAPAGFVLFFYTQRRGLPRI